VLDNFRQIYNKELKHCDCNLEKIILNLRTVRMFVYEVCKQCLKERCKMNDVACTKCDWTGDSWKEVIDYCPGCGSETEYIRDEYLPNTGRRKTMYRNDVYDLVDGERDHQLKRHEKHEVPHKDEDHSVADWITYIEHHIGLAKLWVYHLNTDNALREVRKITALGVACMEYNETPPRESE